MISQPTVSQGHYSYRVKIINPKRKKDAIVRELHKFHGQFKSVTEMKIRWMEELGESVPETIKYSLGYLEGRQETKRWICCRGGSRKKLRVVLLWVWLPHP